MLSEKEKYEIYAKWRKGAECSSDTYSLMDLAEKATLDAVIKLIEEEADSKNEYDRYAKSVLQGLINKIKAQSV